MLADRPSATAFNVAVQRAAHQLLDNGRIFRDPLAVRILGPVGAEFARRMDNRPESKRWRTFMCARAQFTECHLAAAVTERGVRQLVVLGAGLDTFAYRNPHEGALRVFEVDHPATQGWKRNCLFQARIPVPESVRYASVAIGEDDLLAGLEAVGFVKEEPAFFSCLGLFYYLRLDTIRAMLSMIAGFRAQVAFDYSDPPEALSAYERDAVADMQKSLSAAGEPYVSYFEAPELHAMLRSFGFREIEDLDTEAWMDRFGGAKMLAEWRNITADPSRGAHMLSARA